ncbi:MAG: hypothetical protein AB7I30_18045, partial [Isosphaeraceae bacterium]
RLEGGTWRGREGWIEAKGLRVPPTSEESAADLGTVGLPLNTRREIFKAIHAVGMAASEAAEQRYPLSRIPVDGSQRFIEQHRQYYETAKAKGRSTLLARFRINGKQLDSVEEEGIKNRWPLE